MFNDPIVPASARAFLADPRHRLADALDNGLIVGFVSAVIYMHPDKPDLSSGSMKLASRQHFKDRVLRRLF